MFTSYKMKKNWKDLRVYEFKIDDLRLFRQLKTDLGSHFFLQIYFQDFVLPAW